MIYDNQILRCWNSYFGDMSVGLVYCRLEVRVIDRMREIFGAAN